MLAALVNCKQSHDEQTPETGTEAQRLSAVLLLFLGSGLAPDDFSVGSNALHLDLLSTHKNTPLARSGNYLCKTRIQKRFAKLIVF